MSASTPIAKLIESMLADGVDHGAIVRAVETAENGERPRSNQKGTRLSVDWEPSGEAIRYAAGKGMPMDRIVVEAEKFRNFWTAKTGAGATKRDWDATWRNWIINAMERRHGASSGHRTIGAAGRPATGANAVLAGMGRLARRLGENRDAARPQNRQIQVSANASHEPHHEE